MEPLMILLVGKILYMDLQGQLAYIAKRGIHRLRPTTHRVAVAAVSSW